MTGRPGATEVLGGDSLEKLAKTLEFTLARHASLPCLAERILDLRPQRRLIVIRQRDACLVQHLRRCHDRSVDPKRERDGIRRPSTDGLAVFEDELGEEDAVGQVSDLNLDEPVAKSPDDICEQVMGQGSRRLNALLGIGNGGGLDCTDPDRQVSLTTAFAKQHDWLVRRHLYPDSDHVNGFHAFTLPLFGAAHRSEVTANVLPGSAAEVRPELRLYQGRMQPNAKRRKGSGGLFGASFGVGGSAPKQGCHHLLDQAGLPVGS